MNYFDFNDEINGTTNIPSTTTTTMLGNQQNKDLSDWRNIQVGTTPPMFDRYWMPTTVNPYTPPNYQWTNSIPMTTFTGFPLTNPVDTTNDIIDLTINNPVNLFISI